MTQRRRAVQLLGARAPLGATFVALLLLALLPAELAGCGGTTYTAGGATTSTAARTAAATPAAATTTQTSRSVGSARLNGCPVQQSPANASVRGDVIVTAGTGEAAVGESSPQVKVSKGQTLEVQLTAAERWKLTMQSASQVLTPFASNGWYDPSLRACIWRFRASAPGNVSLQFSGIPICTPGAQCSTLAFVEEISVVVHA